MIRIDPDRYVVGFISFGDHLHQYAVDTHTTVSAMASRFMADIDAKRKESRPPYTVEVDGAYVEPWTVVGASLRNGFMVTVVPLKEEG